MLRGAFEFSRMLVFLNLLLKPRLHIIDGIMAMEGNGPHGGDPVKMNVLLLSTDPVAMDAVACAIVDLNPLYVLTMKPGRDCGLGTYLTEEIEIAGDPVDLLRNRDFKVKRGPIHDISVKKSLLALNTCAASAASAARRSVHREL